jgi:hypothetical protein
VRIAGPERRAGADLEEHHMGFLDDAKDAVADGVDKAKDLAAEHSDKITDGIDKAADFADDKTGGKHTDKIDSAAEKAKGFVAGLDKDGQ